MARITRDMAKDLADNRNELNPSLERACNIIDKLIKEASDNGQYSISLGPIDSDLVELLQCSKRHFCHVFLFYEKQGFTVISFDNKVEILWGE